MPRGDGANHTRRTGRRHFAQHAGFGSSIRRSPSPARGPATCVPPMSAAIDRMRVGDFAQRRETVRDRLGQPLSARSKDGYLGAARQFFRDCQEWGWMPRRFDPARALATPRAVKALIGPAPRIIADDLWAKLLWAGLNLTTADLTTARNARNCYPVELVRALAVTWLSTSRAIPIGSKTSSRPASSAPPRPRSKPVVGNFQ